MTQTYTELETLGILATRVDIQELAVLAEVAFAEEQPDMVLACRAHRFTADDQALRFLGQPGTTAHTNLRSHMRMIGLLDDDDQLTGLGQDVAEGGLVPVPEQGVYRVWTVNHELTGHRILHIERAATSFHDDIYKDIEPYRLPVPRGAFTSVVTGEPMVLRELLDPASAGLPRGDTKVNVRLRGTSTCHLHWELKLSEEGVWQNRWRFRGKLGGSRSIKDDNETESAEGVDWHRLLDMWLQARNLGAWDRERTRHSISFEDLNLEAREHQTFSREKIELEDLEVPGCGTWERGIFADLALQPKDLSDAHEWSWLLLEEELEQYGYITTPDIQDVFEDLVDACPPLKRHDPFAPDPEMLIKRLRTHQRYPTYWHVVAPRDLAPRSGAS